VQEIVVPQNEKDGILELASGLAELLDHEAINSAKIRILPMLIL